MTKEEINVISIKVNRCSGLIKDWKDIQGRIDTMNVFLASTSIAPIIEIPNKDGDTFQLPAKKEIVKAILSQLQGEKREVEEKLKTLTGDEPG